MHTASSCQWHRVRVYLEYRDTIKNPKVV